MDGASSIEIAVKKYNQTLTMLLDKHVTLKKKHIKPTKLQPWFTDKIRNKIWIRRLKERLWENDLSEYTYSVFYQQNAF